jgi:hypothetical protein
MHHGDAVAELLGLVHVVGHEHDRRAAVADELPRDAPGGRIQALRQLVEEHDLGLVDERERDEEALPLAAGEARERQVSLRIERWPPSAPAEALDALDATPTPCRTRSRRVPTGAFYVDELTGVPFAVGAASVYRVAPPLGPQTYLSGFTAIIDLALARDGSLYMLQFATEPLLSGPAR